MSRYQYDFKEQRFFFFRYCRRCQVRFRPKGRETKYCEECQKINQKQGAIKRREKLIMQHQQNHTHKDKEIDQNDLSKISDTN